ncbi:MAG TPA: hypothetical protein PKC43_06335 [Phycisphaerales bacterium]|nr:hypothetical protein [Phycisphaerales bacterium]HMP37050.1 hypothetical protein [Phycisphaerales bacterium]
MLTRAGGVRVSEAMIEADVADGAPTNADGTLHLVHYCAWLAAEVSRQQGGGRAHRPAPPETG